jgi:signal transduction histidine kinase
MSTRRWSLANRLTLWMSGVALLPGLATFLLGGLFLELTRAGDLDLLLREEVAETLTALRAAERPLEAFPAICRELTAHHPTTPLAWRLSDDAKGTLLAEGGSVRILAEYCAGAMAIDETIRPARGFAVRTERFTDDWLCLVAVDGRSQSGLVDEYWVVGGVLIAATTVLAMLVGRLLARRVAGLLLNVAADVRAATGTAELPVDQGAPEEIRAVVDGLRGEMQRIREGSERMRLFTAGLAHELRSPLQNLIGQAEVTLLRPRDPREYAGVMVSQLDELTELSDAIDNLLAMCSASAGTHGEPREEFDLGKEAELRLQRERARAEREGVELQIVATGDVRLTGNREGALRGVRNVVANAIDWTPRGGRVRVSIDGDPARVAVTIDDSGPGVPEAERAQIFEPFLQGPAPERHRIGYGLGLAIAQAAVAEHGGRIEVATSPLGGARFQLTFLREPTAAAAAATRAAPASRPRTRDAGSIASP